MYAGISRIDATSLSQEALRLDGELVASLGSASFDDSLSGFGRHSLQKAAASLNFAERAA